MDMELFFKRLQSPIGEISIYADEKAVVGLLMDQPDKKGLRRKYKAAREKDSALLIETGKELQAFFAGRLQKFTVPVEFTGTDFQIDVWKSLQSIEFGKLATYADIARQIGRPAAVRAVGGAIGRNPVSIIVPCHRVIGSNDSLTGFGGGLPAKQLLLEIEGHTITNLKLDRP
jgi:methylated-DNA-[protein]-cysteine S-methyltransferase